MSYPKTSSAKGDCPRRLPGGARTDGADFAEKGGCSGNVRRSRSRQAEYLPAAGRSSESKTDKSWFPMPATYVLAMLAAQFELHAQIEERHWWFVARRRILADLIANLAPPDPAATVLDVGCGAGANLA